MRLRSASEQPMLSLAMTTALRAVRALVHPLSRAVACRADFWLIKTVGGNFVVEIAEVFVTHDFGPPER